jgi:alpha-L-fucosidase
MRFNLSGFDSAAWARTARRAGMKYIVLTTKHHDGFALFDSRVSDFSVMATPFHRDVVAEVVQACRREGLRVGFYYSIMDWHHPDDLPRRDWETTRPNAGAEFDRYVRYMKAQLGELLTHYGPIDVLWFDGQWEGTWSNDRGRDLCDYVRSLQPSIVVNDRAGRTRGGSGLDRSQPPIGHFGPPEREVPPTGLPGVDWETCMTMNRNWGYNRADKAFKTAPELIRTLVDVASKGGNLLLNVGPDADGRFPPERVERLEAVGRWMDINGVSLHGTTASPFPRLAWGRCTQRRLPGGGTRLHVFDWPPDGRLAVEGLLSRPARAVLLARPSVPLEVTAESGGVVVRVPEAAVDAADTVIAVDLDEPPDVAVSPVIPAATPVFVETLDVEVASVQERMTLRYTLDGTDPALSSAMVA